MKSHENTEKMMENSHSEPELLLPVGNSEMCLAAIHSGADAIYVGVPGFNARGRSKDFEMDELKSMIDLCHLHHVKVNLAFNIVIFEDELEEASELLYKLMELNPDAFIVQDLGLVRLIKKINSKAIVHASTQMTVTNHHAIKFLSDLNIKRFVLGRENSLSEIKAISENTDKELEVFVHGALCVAYSGQCFTSESIGGRSANRGQCAQSCRFEYDLLVDGKKKNLVDRNYLVSPKDLCGALQIPSLLEYGVKSFKVEGRLKGSEYVTSAAKLYKPLLSQEKLSKENLDQRIYDASLTYSRGFFPGWLNGVNHQELVEGSFNEHRGLEIGIVQDVLKNKLKIQTLFEISNGDGLLFHFIKDNKRREIGSRVFHSKKISEKHFEVELHNFSDYSKNLIGARVFKNSDPVVQKKLTQNLNNKELKKRLPITLEINVELRQKLIVKVTDQLKKFQFEVFSNNELIESTNEKLTYNDSLEKVVDELKSLSGTQYLVQQCNVIAKTDKAFFIHGKEVKELRKQFCTILDHKRLNELVDGIKLNECLDKNSLNQFIFDQKVKLNYDNEVLLNVLLRDREQVFDLVNSSMDFSKIKYVILDFEFGKNYNECLDLLRKNGIKSAIATNRILKPNEYHHLNLIVRLNPDAVLVRNLGAFEYLRNELHYSGKLFGDFSLNITNHLSYDYLLSKGFDSLCLSYDLSSKRVHNLLKYVDATHAEITIHQYMPSFHMEHCVFAAFLSKGSSYKDCGKPCEKHRVELVDQFGHRHHIRADQECRNTMFNATSQSAVSFLDEFRKYNLGNVRFEAMYERGDELISKIVDLIKVISHEMETSEFIKKQNMNEAYGISDGAFGFEQEYKARKKS